MNRMYPSGIKIYNEWSKAQKHLGPILIAWFNMNPCMDKYSHAQERAGWNYLSSNFIYLSSGL